MTHAPTSDDWRILHDYWFGTLEASEAYVPSRLPIWFFASAQEDAYIQEHFVPWLTTISDEVQEAWKQTPQGFLTLILLFDQVPRNAYRGTPDAYRYDGHALELARAFLARPETTSLDVVERFFVYLPFQHQEDVPNQEISVRGIRALSHEAPACHAAFFRKANEMAERHLEAIASFGRFPHRNVIFDRTSSPEELVFLEDPENNF